MSTVEERIKQSETRVFRAMFPDRTNHYQTLFGGLAMQLMDEVAFITATRFCRLKMVTVSSDKIEFKKPVPAGALIEVIGRVSHIGTNSLQVLTEIYMEEMYSDKRELAITGTFTFVALGEDNKSTKIPV